MTNLEYENTRLLDVVNEADEVIDSKLRTEVHQQGLLHRQVYVWMFDKDKNVFFQKRGMHSPSAGLLDATVGGHINKGEDYIDAAIRETKEETGISIFPIDLVFLKKFKSLRPSQDPIFGTINNFFGAVYIYKNPITEELLQKEVGIPGGGFQKLSYDFLSNPDKEYIKMFHPVVLNEQIKDILEYLK